jgi:hypothetical protein
MTRKLLRFALHYLEMVVAMFAGMYLLAPLWTAFRDDVPVHTLTMALDMTIGSCAAITGDRSPRCPSRWSSRSF